MERRTERSQTFDNGDGTLTTLFFTTPVFFKVQDKGSWRPIELGFLPSSDPGLAAISDRAPTSVAVANEAGADSFLTLRAKGRTIRFGLPADLRKVAAKTKPTFDGPAADFADFQPGVDLRILAGAHGAKSFFIWRERPAKTTIRYVVDAPGLTLRKQADGSIAMVDPAGTEVARIPRPFAVDSTKDAFAGSGRFTEKVSLAIAKDGRTVTISVDPDWLAAAEFPVHVDPSTGWVYNAGTNAYGDAHVASNYPTLNFDDYQRPDSPFYHELWNGTDPSGTSGTSYDFLRWDLSAINNSTIDSASLALVPYHQYYNAPTQETTYARRVTSSWTESGVTWNAKPTYTTTGTATQGCVEGNWCTWAVTSIVQVWATTPSTNFGFQIDTIGKNSTFWKRFIASEQGGTNRPRLSVTYHTPTASPATPTGWRNSRALAWTYADTSGHAGSHYEFDVDTDANFAAPLTHDGAAVAGAGTTASIPTSVTLTSGTTYHWRVRVKDGTSWSPWATRTFQWDATAPTGTISLNGGAAYATSSTVTATLSMSDAHSGPSQMRFSTNGGTSWSAFEPYATSKAWALPAGDGPKTLSVQFQDAATNTSATYSDALTVDTVNPLGTISINGGAVSTNTTSVTLNVTASDATSGVAATHSSNDGTTWTLVTGTTVPWTLTTGDGTKTVYHRVTDGAGRTTTVTDTILLASDSTPPGAPSQPDLVAASDTGASSTDNITNDATPTFTGTAEADSTVTIHDGPTAVGSGLASGGVYTVTTSSLPNGVRSITATATDASNNTGPSSTALSVTIDTTSPAVPSTPDLDAASDSGSSTTDNVTTDTTPTLSGTAEAGTTVSLLDGATPSGSGTATAGAWTITASVLSDGSHALTVRATDTAGNQSGVSSALSVTVDTIAPTAPTGLDLAAASDSGSSSTDNITTDTTPTLTGVAEAGTTVSLLDGAAPVGSATATGGAWTITSSALSSAAHTFTTRATDTAGNLGPASTTLVVTIDAVAPSADYTTPNEATTIAISASSYGVGWSENGTGSTVATRSLQRRSGTVVTPGTCAGVSFATDGSPVSTTSPVTSSGLTTERCYQWVQTLTDTAGNSAPISSGFVIVGAAGPSSEFTTPNESTTSRQYTTGYTVDWIESGPVATSRSLQRQRAAIATAGSCAGLTFADDGAPITTAAPVVVTGLAGGYCYQWTQTLTAGTSSTATSGTVLIDVTPPTVTVGTPAVDVIQAATNLTVSWTEADVHAGVVNRTVQREVGLPIEPGTCTGVIWASDGPTSVNASPLGATGLVSGRCYRWVITVNDRAGNGYAQPTGLVLVDTSAPDVSWTAPAGPPPVAHGATAIDVDWIATDAAAGLTSTSIQREAAAPSGGGCPANGWTNDGSAATTVPPLHVEGLQPSTCYRWVLTASDAANNIRVSTSPTVLTSAALIESSAPGDTVFEIEPVDASLDGSISVASVELLVDGATVGSDAATPFTIPWTTTGLTDGHHTLALRAQLVGGGSVTSAPVSVQVDNALSAAERVLADDTKGRLTPDEFALYGVYAVGSVWSLPPRYQSDTASKGFVDDAQFTANLEDLEPATQNEINAFLAQPYRGEGYQPPPNAPFEERDHQWVDCFDTLILVRCEREYDHFTLYYGQPSDTDSTRVGTADTLDDSLLANSGPDGVPDYINKLGIELERARIQYAAMGYQQVGDRISVYLNAGVLCPETRECAHADGNIYVPPTTNRPYYTARHELFHRFQANYLDKLVVDYWFWFEGSAEWATKILNTAERPGPEYAGSLVPYLKSRNEPLTKNEDGRKYGTWLFATYLQQRFGSDFIHKTWDTDGEFWDVVSQAAAAEPNAATLEEILLDYAESAYLFDFANEPDFADWREDRLNHDDPVEPEVHGDAVNPNGRPHTSIPVAPGGAPAWGVVAVHPSGFDSLEFVPPPNTFGTIKIDVFQADALQVSAKLMRMGAYPTNVTPPDGPIAPVCDTTTLNFPTDPAQTVPGPAADPIEWGHAEVEIAINPACPYAALVLAHTLGEGDVKPIWYTATFVEDARRIDDFNRQYTATATSDSYGVSSSGEPWIGAGIEALGSRGADGSYGYVDGSSPTPHIELPASLRGQEFTATVRFRFNGPPATTTSQESSWLYVGVSDIVKHGYFYGEQSPFVEIDFNNGLSEGNGQMGLWGGDANEDPDWQGDWVFIPTEQDVVDFTSSTWYTLKYHFVPGVKHESKMWQLGDPEPDYQISDSMDYRWAEAPGVPGAGPLQGKYLWLDVRGFNGLAEVDYLDVVGGGGNLDDFERTVASGWGTASSALSWSATGDTDTLLVDGSNGVVAAPAQTLTIVRPSIDAPVDSTTPWGATDAFTMTSRFKVDHVYSSSAYTTLVYKFERESPSDDSRLFAFEITNHTSPGNIYATATNQGGQSNEFYLPKADWIADWYMIKWELEPGVSSKFKIWPESEPEPAAWTGELVDTGGLSLRNTHHTRFTIEVWNSAAGLNNAATLANNVRIDYIHFEEAASAGP